MVPQEVVLFLTLEVVLFLTLERLKRGTKTNSPAYIYIFWRNPFLWRPLSSIHNTSIPLGKRLVSCGGGRWNKGTRKKWSAWVLGYDKGGKRARVDTHIGLTLLSSAQRENVFALKSAKNPHKNSPQNPPLCNLEIGNLSHSAKIPAEKKLLQKNPKISPKYYMIDPWNK